MIERAGRLQLRFARERPNDVLQYCNRGCVWLSMVALCGLYLNDDRYRQATDAHAQRILHAVLAEDGEVQENYLHYHGGGPDSGYSYTIWVYAMMYRLLSGRADFDDRLMRSLQWMLRYATRHGEPLAAAASVRKIVDKGALVEDLLPALEFYADQEPFLDRLAQRFSRHPVRHVIGGHTVDPAIWALLLHRPRPQRAAAPSWYRDHEDHHEHQATHYSIVHHRYQTALVYRGLFDCRGLQSFAYGDEVAIVQHAPDHVSSNHASKTQSAAMQVTGGLYGWEVFLRRGGPGNGHEPASPGTVILTRRERMWEAFIFTRASVICVMGVEGAKGKDLKMDLAMNWALQETQRSPAMLDRRHRRVSFVGRRAMIHTLGGKVNLQRVEADRPVLQLQSSRGPLVTGLGAADLRLEKLDRRRCQLDFADATGRYRFSFARMFDDRGQLDRIDQWYRLEKLSTDAGSAG